MKVPQMIAAELRRLTSSRMSLVALIALVAVPVIYGGLYLWANKDPYGSLSEVPAAIVVADAGDDGRSVGADVADNLVDDGRFDWHVVSAAQAESGLADGDYDFSITFPADFSAALASAAGSDPRQADVVFATNDANNYLATTIGTQAVATIRSQVAQEVGREAAVRFLDGLDEIRGKLGDAADGAGRLTDAAATAADGGARLADGASALADGTATLAGASSQLASGAARVADGNAAIAAKADAVGSTVAAVGARVPELRAELEQRLEADGVDAETVAQALAAFDSASGPLSEGADEVRQVVGQIDDLAAGARQVSDGAATLATGAASAASGAATLRDGSASLADGLTQLDAGAGTLRDGLAEGTAAIPATTAGEREAQADTIADPVAVETDAVTAAGDYGAGLTPFFAALAGWIGIYALFLIVKPVSRRAVTAVHSPVRVTLAGWLTPTILGAVQMSVLYGVLSLVLGFEVANPAGMLGIMLLASGTFAAIVLALNVWLGSVGQFLGLVLMVLQLVTAGGTFPWQTLPEPLAALHHVLPMGYVVEALRQSMYGGNALVALGDVSVLLVWLGASFALAAIGVTRMTHFRTLRDLRPSLIG